VHETVRSPGRPLDPVARRELETRFGHDFSRVRVHTDERAAESARAVDALAYTVGQEIVFEEGQYAPSTASGRALLAHELAHVVQQERGLGGDEATAEREANAAAAGRASAAGRAAGALQRQPAAGEDPDLKARRIAAANAARIAIDRVRLALQRGYLFEGEEFEDDLIRTLDDELESPPERQARLRRLASDLHDLLVQLDAGPVPDSWFEEQTEQGKLSVGVHDGEWQDVSALYLHRQVSLGRDLEASSKNVFYIRTEPVPEKRTKGAAIAGGIQTGRFVVVPDAENDPLRVYSVSPSTTTTEGEIVELWHDDLGYYYLYGGRKIYLPKGAV
jgi:hypothetical protein